MNCPNEKERTMELQELKDKLAADKGTFEFSEGDDGVYIRNKRYDTKIHASYEAIEKHDWMAIKAQTVGGRDVAHITRVTGYFTIVEGWNKGKIGELRDRNRAAIK